MGALFGPRRLGPFVCNTSSPKMSSWYNSSSKRRPSRQPDDASPATVRLYRACKRGDPEAVREAIRDGADVEWEGDDKCLRPLMVVSTRQCDMCAAVEIIHLLCDSGADVAAETDGKSALYRATVFGHLGKADGIMLALLGRGAHWSTAFASRNINMELVDFALEAERARRMDKLAPYGELAESGQLSRPVLAAATAVPA